MRTYQAQIPGKKISLKGVFLDALLVNLCQMPAHHNKLESTSQDTNKIAARDELIVDAHQSLLDLS